MCNNVEMNCPEDNPSTSTIKLTAGMPAPFCPAFHAATELIGKRWTGAIIYSLFHGLRRFSELKEAIPGLSSRMLSERLKELEAEEMIIRNVIPSTPVVIEYELTPKGTALREVMLAISRWAAEWQPGNCHEHSPPTGCP